MENLVDYTVIIAIFEQLFEAFSKNAFAGGLMIGASLELLGYGIFKAVSLLNIKY